MLEPHGITRDEPHPRVKGHLEVHLLGVGRGSRGVERTLNHRGKVDVGPLQPQPPGGDARDVEHVLDEPRLRVARPLHHVERPRRPLRRELPLTEHLHPSEHRLERCAELVGHRRDELVLQLVRLLRLLVEAGVVDGDPGAAAELLREREIRPAVRPPGLRGRQRERTEDVAPGHERDDDPRAIGERTEIAETVAAAGHLHEHLVRHLRDQDGLARPQNARARMLPLRVRRIDLRPADDRRLCRVGASDRQAAYQVVGVDDVDRAPVRHERHDELGEPDERLLVVERRREHGAGLCEELPAAGGGLEFGLRALPLGDVPEMPREHRFPRRGDGRDRELDRELASVRPHRGELDPLPDRRPLAGLEVFLETATMALAQRRRDDHVCHRPPDHLGTRVPERPLRRGIELQDQALTVHGDDAVEGEPDHLSRVGRASLRCAGVARIGDVLYVVSRLVLALDR